MSGNSLLVLVWRLLKKSHENLVHFIIKTNMEYERKVLIIRFILIT